MLKGVWRSESHIEFDWHRCGAWYLLAAFLGQKKRAVEDGGQSICGGSDYCGHYREDSSWADAYYGSV